MKPLEYELQFGYYGSCSATYTLTGFEKLGEAIEKLKSILKDPQYDFGYIVKIEKKVLFPSELGLRGKNEIL